MGLFSGLFGSETSETELPDWVVGPATEMLQRSVDMGKAGYMPWTGPSVAAIDRSQVAGMRNNQDMAAAFGMQTAMPNIMPATDYGNGVFGHSAMPLYDQNMATLQETRPGQMDYYNSFFVDPVTGVEGANMNQAQQGTAGPVTYEQKPFFEGNEYWSDQAIRQRGIDDVLYGHLGGMAGQSVQPAMQGPQQPSQGVLGGYSGLGDMFDGGGPGASGDKFGGALGGISNAMGKKPGGGLLGGLFG